MITSNGLLLLVYLMFCTFVINSTACLMKNEQFILLFSSVLFTWPLYSIVILKHARPCDTSIMQAINIDGLTRYVFLVRLILWYDLRFGSSYYKLRQTFTLQFSIHSQPFPSFALPCHTTEQRLNTCRTWCSITASIASAWLFCSNPHHNI